MRFLPLLLVLALAACSSDSSTPTSYLGKSYDELVALRGKPGKNYKLVGDAQLVQYTNKGFVTSPNGKQKEQTCTSRFWIYENKVKHVTYDGDDAVCEQARSGMH